MPLFTPGLRLRDRYLLVERLGAGGMSEVWRATDELLDRPVAVKVLAAALSGDPALREAIWHEARAVARLNHPHVTQVYDYGELPLPADDAAGYLVMELVDGPSLASRLASGPLPWPRAAQLAGQVAAALAAAHRIGVVHRDIKPGNVMLTAAGAKVLDFGIAAAVGRAGADAGRLVGTPAYTAPERFDAIAPVQPASDVYSLGVLLYECVAGRPPWQPRTWEEAAQMARDRAGLAPPRPQQPGLPAELAALCQSCLAPDPGERPGAEAVSRTLATLPSRAQEELVTQAGSAGTDPATVAMPRRYAVGAAALPAPDTVSAAARSATQIDDRPAPPGRRRPWLVGALAVAAGIGLALALLAAGLRLFDGAPGPGAGESLPPATSTPGTSSPATSTPATPPASAAPAEPLQIVNALEQAIADAFQTGEITRDARDDLREELDELRDVLAEGPGQRVGQLRQAAEDLREEVEDLREDGEIDAATAARLADLLAPLLGGTG